MTHRRSTSGSTVILTSLVLCWALTGPAVAQDTQGFSGHWTGAIEVPGSPLEIRIDFEQSAGDCTGAISIPAQGIDDLALAEVKADGARISFKIPGIPGDPAFAGTLAGDGMEISGEFTQGGATLPFKLQRGQDPAAAAGTALQGFDEVCQKALEDWAVPGMAVGVVVGDEVVFARGFGLRDRERDVPVTPRTLFAIGSCTKAFTTFAMGTLVDEGALDWDEPVIRYLPAFRLQDDYASTHITPRDLVTHRSGLPRHDLVWYNNTHDTRADLVRRLRHLPPSKELRQAFQYNNLMYMTAGYLVGRLTGGTWEQAVRQRIFEPLGMSASNFSVGDSQGTSDFAQPYEEEDDEVSRTAFRNIDMVGPAGSINSNIEDMTRWLMVHLSNGRIGDRQVIQSATLRELHTPQMAINVLPEETEVSPGSYALGWGTDTYYGHYRVRHGGGIDGFITSVCLFPNDDAGIVVFCNITPTPLPGLITLHAADRLLGLEHRDWLGEALENREQARAEQEEAEKKKDLVRKAGTKPSHDLAEYAGEYEHAGYGVLTIEHDGSAVVMTFNDIRTSLEHWHHDVFNGLKNPDDQTFEDSKIRFLTNMRGDIAGVAANFEPAVEEVVFERLPDRRMLDPDYLGRFLGVYELAEMKATVGLEGTVLVLTVAGQPKYELVPERDDEFNLEGLAGFSVKFIAAEDGGMMARFIQPNGVFDATRKQD